MSRVADPKAKIALLRAAEEVFAERGLVAAKVEDIAKRAGLSKGAFYLHFESKESALKHVVESFLAHVGAFFAPPSAYPDLSDDAAELVDFSIERDVQLYEFLWQNRAILKILGTCHGEFDYLVQSFRDDIAARNREWLEHWRRLGMLRDEVDLDLAVSLIGGAYHELTVKMLAEADRPDFERWLQFAQESFIRAFGAPELVAVVDRRNRRVSFDIEPGAPGRASRARHGRAADRGRS